MNAKIVMFVKPNLKTIFLIFVFFVTTFLLATNYVANGYKRESNSQALIIREEKIKKADELILQNFRQWSKTSRDKELVLIWEGKDSEILWIDYQKAISIKSGFGFQRDYDDAWSLTARTKGGRFFVVRYVLDVAGNFVETTFLELPNQDIAMTLIERRRFDLLDKFGLAYEKA